MYIGLYGPCCGLRVGKLCTLVYMVLVHALYGNGSYVHWFMCPSLRLEGGMYIGSCGPSLGLTVEGVMYISGLHYIRYTYFKDNLCKKGKKTQNSQIVKKSTLIF